MGTAISLMKIGTYRYNFSVTEALFCGLLFSAFPALRIIFEVGAHPDAPYFFFASLAVYYFYKEKHILSAVFILLSILFKRAGIIVPIYIITFLVADNKNKPINYWHLLYYIVAVVYGYFMPKLFLSNIGFTPNHAKFFNQIINSNKGALFAYFLNNFQVLTFPFLLFMLKRPFAEKLAMVMVLMAGLLTHMYNVVDWWRIWFGLLFIWAIPGSIAYFKSFKNILGSRGFAVLMMFLLFAIYQSPALLNFDKIKEPPTATYLMEFGILISLEILDRIYKLKVIVNGNNNGNN